MVHCVNFGKLIETNLSAKLQKNYLFADIFNSSLPILTELPETIFIYYLRCKFIQSLG